MVTVQESQEFENSSSLIPPFFAKLSKQDISVTFFIVILVMQAAFLYASLSDVPNFNRDNCNRTNSTSAVPPGINVANVSGSTNQSLEAKKDLKPLPPWKENSRLKLNPVSLIDFLGFSPRPEFVSEFCPRHPMQNALYKSTLYVAQRFYYGYGTTKKDAKKMAAALAIKDLYGKDSPDTVGLGFITLMNFKESCGI